MRKVSEYELRAEECREACGSDEGAGPQEAARGHGPRLGLLARARFKHLQRGYDGPAGIFTLNRSGNSRSVV